MNHIPLCIRFLYLLPSSLFSLSLYSTREKKINIFICAAVVGKENRCLVYSRLIIRPLDLRKRSSYGKLAVFSTMQHNYHLSSTRPDGGEIRFVMSDFIYVNIDGETIRDSGVHCASSVLAS